LVLVGLLVQAPLQAEQIQFLVPQLQRAVDMPDHQVLVLVLMGHQAGLVVVVMVDGHLRLLTEVLGQVVKETLVAMGRVLHQVMQMAVAVGGNLQQVETQQAAMLVMAATD
jgi:hypothetical protein